MRSSYGIHTYIHTIICNARNVCQLAESEARAVTGGKWRVKKQQKNNVFKLRLNELTDGELRIIRGMALCCCTVSTMLLSSYRTRKSETKKWQQNAEPENDEPTLIPTSQKWKMQGHDPENNRPIHCLVHYFLGLTFLFALHWLHYLSG